MKKLLIIGLVFFLNGCEQKQSTTPQGANNKTPIKLVICGEGDVDCFVNSRFKDLKSCEYYKKISSMRCDNYAEKGKIICEDMNYARSLETPSYCLPE